MEEIFQPVVQKRLVNVLSFDIPKYPDIVECCLGETPSYFTLYTKEEAPRPFGEMKAFCSYLKGKEGGIIQPMVSVRKEDVPKEFEDVPGMFYHIAAFYTLMKTVTGSSVVAMLRTFREIGKDKDTFERYSRHCMCDDDFPTSVVKKYLEGKQDLDALSKDGKLKKEQYSWLLDQLEEECIESA